MQGKGLLSAQGADRTAATLAHSTPSCVYGEQVRYLLARTALCPTDYKARNTGAPPLASAGFVKTTKSSCRLSSNVFSPASSPGFAETIACWHTNAHNKYIIDWVQCKTRLRDRRYNNSPSFRNTCCTWYVVSDHHQRPAGWFATTTSKLTIYSRE